MFEEFADRVSRKVFDDSSDGENHPNDDSGKGGHQRCAVDKVKEHDC
jgi:hypothetical protein